MTPLRKIAAALVIALVSVIALELGYRAVGGDEKKEPRREKLRDFLRNGHPIFRPWPYVGFVARRTPDRADDPTRPVAWRFDLSPDHSAPRIACLGASTTWGTYPLRLENTLAERTGTSYEVMNWGVPGWTTQETMVNYFCNVQDYRPDIVVIHHSLNDVPARLREGFRSDYGHYRRPWVDVDIPIWKRWLLLHSDFYADRELATNEGRFSLGAFVEMRPTGNVSEDAPAHELPPDTGYSFRRNVRTIIEHAQSKGARVALMTMPYKASEAKPTDDGAKPLWVLGMEEHNEILRELARDHGCLLVDAEAWAKADVELSDPLFVDRVHMPEGTQRKVDLLIDAMEAAGWLN